jgi:hypothetical protein
MKEDGVQPANRGASSGEAHIKGGQAMSKERKVDESELEEISGTGGESDISSGHGPELPVPPELKPEPPGGSGGDDPEPVGNDGPGYQHYG